ncbi:acidic repeat-containing protein-like isoform X1 [Rana temporaria]|uniref:acidic repeat-containing protein-like isoform X1 n=1 Tax=Rana temporaria TaxID=8407 RepID=UPI001AAD716D|nr:acidic repeat-containing protein-like isoform X1 [Rana temporaria]
MASEDPPVETSTDTLIPVQENLSFQSFLRKRKDTMKFNWATYWFKLQNTTLYFYTNKDQQETSLRGQYYMFSVQSVRSLSDADGDFTFEIVMKNGKRKLLSAESAELRDVWVRLLWKSMQLPGPGRYKSSCTWYDIPQLIKKFSFSADKPVVVADDDKVTDDGRPVVVADDDKVKDDGRPVVVADDNKVKDDGRPVVVADDDKVKDDGRPVVVADDDKVKDDGRPVVVADDNKVKDDGRPVVVADDDKVKDDGRPVVVSDDNKVKDDGRPVVVADDVSEKPPGAVQTDGIDDGRPDAANVLQQFLCSVQPLYSGENSDQSSDDDDIYDVPRPQAMNLTVYSGVVLKESTEVPDVSSPACVPESPAEESSPD